MDGSEEQATFLALARLCSPCSTVGQRKIRLGRVNDGGYVMLDDFAGIVAAYSFGVGDDISWDVEIAQRGVPTYQLDDTLDQSPTPHSNLTFIPAKIGSSADSAGETIKGLLDRYSPGAGSASLILKIDIEGDEWSVFDDVDVDDLSRFAQIVCEFHDFHRATEPLWYHRALRVMQKLRLNFEVVHVHGNNYAGHIAIANVPFPQVLEITFANRARYRFTACEEIFPTSLDQPNTLTAPDLFLGSFKFESPAVSEARPAGNLKYPRSLKTVFAKAPASRSPLDDDAQAELRAKYYGIGLSDCVIYHTYDMPDGSEITGVWDLRDNWRTYLGGLDFDGQRVLELGPASGYLTFKMEAMGASLVAFELPPGVGPDILPLPGIRDEDSYNTRAKSIEMIHNSWWFFHRHFQSKAKAAYGNIYELPRWLGRFDVSVFASILLHLANPFAAVRQAAAMTDHTIVVTELYWPSLGDRALLEFSPSTSDPMYWWQLSPGAISRMLTAVGFPTQSITYHEHRHHSLPHKFFTVVARRD